jgi:ribonuclease BN (tRNA processing enzyme)
MKTKNILIVLLILALAACGVLGYFVSSKQQELTSNTALSDMLSEQLANLEKTTVPADDYNNLVKQLESIRTTAVSMGQISPNQSLKPEQICMLAKQIMTKQQQMLNSAAAAVAAANAKAAQTSSLAGEVDFLVSVVEKEISQMGVVDSQQADKFAVTLYHMQKVLDALGYKLNDTVKTTNEAVLKFQTDNQLKPDGKIGAKTWAKIRELWNAKKTQGI